MAVTMMDIAKRANVSRSTVSLVISDRWREMRISPDTREKVLKAIREMGYVPNLYARSLRRQSTFTIGMVATNILHPAVAMIVEGAKKAATQKKYKIILGISSDQPDQERDYIENFRSRRVDGLIVIPSPCGSTILELEKLSSTGFPLVLCQDDSTAKVDFVASGVEAGAYEATKYLFDLGHRRIAICSGRPTWISALAKYRGYRRAMEDCGLSLDDRFYIRTENSNLAAGRNAAEQILKLDERPDGVLFHNDEMAAGAMLGLREAHVRIPEDMSLIGFDNLSLSKATPVPLTTVASSLDEVGRIATEILLAKIEAVSESPQDKKSNQELRSVRLVPKLIIRNSCAARK
ncbi:MAG: LacI family transcriptional regulator [Phycisphaerae bacterium]|nr:LacI family transcriptional regulator [Phycisphaerae bacterium]